MKEENALEEYLEEVYPQNGELQVDDEGGIYTTIVDVELDGYRCNFNNDGCVEIVTEGYTHICLDPATLLELADLAEKAQEMYDTRTDEEWKKYGLEMD